MLRHIACVDPQNSPPMALSGRRWRPLAQLYRSTFDCFAPRFVEPAEDIMRA